MILAHLVMFSIILRRSQAATLFGAVILFTSFLAGFPVEQAEAQSSLTRKLVANGQLPRSEALRAVQSISAQMSENAQNEALQYDWLRKRVNSALFADDPGPGKTREIYNARLQSIIARLKKPFDEDLLPALFTWKKDGPVMCAYRWRLPIGVCDALIAVAKDEKVEFPYARADEGVAFGEALRKSKVKLKVRKEIVKQLAETMKNVPSNLSEDARGASLVQLLTKCPGDAKREAQVRAWHSGPTLAMALCISTTLGEMPTEDRVANAKAVLNLSDASADTFLKWGNPDFKTTKVKLSKKEKKKAKRRPRVTVIKNADTLRLHAQLHLARKNYDAAIRSLNASLEVEPKSDDTHVMLAEIHTKRGDFKSAAKHFDAALALKPNNLGYMTELARAFAKSGDKENAIKVLQAAVKIDRNYRPALAGLKSLGGDLPPPPPRELPQTLPRGDVIATMQMLNGGVQECAPTFEGKVVVKIVITGETGDVDSASLVGGPLKGKPEAECITGVVQGAEFPRFKKKTMTIKYPYELKKAAF